MAVSADEVVGKLPCVHLTAEVGEFKDFGLGVRAAAEDGGGGVDLEEEVSVEEVMEAGGLATG